MASRAPLIAVPKNLYKHFAALTVAITACVAIFADGENKQVLAKQIEQHRERAAKRGQFTGGGTQRTVGGLRDNRGYVVNGNDDVGSAPSLAPQSPLLVTGQVNEGSLASAVRRPPAQRAVRKLPPVLPPGMPAIPGLPETAPLPAPTPTPTA